MPFLVRAVDISVALADCRAAGDSTEFDGVEVIPFGEGGFLQERRGDSGLGIDESGGHFRCLVSRAFKNRWWCLLLKG